MTPRVACLAAAAGAIAAACGAPATPVPAAVAADPPAPAPPAVTVELDTAPGLSGLAIDAAGVLWTVAERDAAAFAIRLDGERVAAITRHPLRGLPDHVDVEAIEVLADGRLALGTEGADGVAAAVWLAAPAPDGGFDVTALPGVSASALGVAVAHNHGIEGLCGDASGLVAAFETVVEDGGARWAHVVVAAGAPGAPTTRLVRVRLTTATGKLSGLHCDGDHVLAIERHFEVTRVVRFPIDAAAVDAELVVELAGLAGGRNFEGLARLPDGRIALVVDNQWRTIEGPSALVLVRADQGF